MKEKHQAIGLRTLEDISFIILHSHNLQETLRNIVTIVSKRLHTDVCSIYLLENDGETLMLKATKGLSRNSVNRVSMKISEGLAGLAIESRAMVMTENAPAHPRFKYFKEAREEKFLSFLGLPLFERQTPIGVIIVQTRQARSFSEDEISALRTISIQISGIILNAKLLDSIQNKEQERAWFEQELSKIRNGLTTAGSSFTEQGTTGAMRTLSGIAVSGGFVHGKAFILDRFSDKVVKAARAGSQEEELGKFMTALEKVKIHTVYMEKRVSETLGTEDSAIFHTHLMILEDRSFCGKITELISQGMSAVRAAHDVVSHYITAFSAMEDPYLRERSADMEDIGRRIIDAIEGNGNAVPELEEKRILVAEDIFPSTLAMLDHDKILGIITEKGNVYSHAAIMARSLGIPSVLGISGLMDAVDLKDDIIVDGTSGQLFITPTASVVSEYERLEKEFAGRRKELEGLHGLPAVTTDGHKIVLSANIGLLSDIRVAKLNGAEGVGLYRTEFPYMTRSAFPTREEQTDIYRKVLEAFPEQTVNIRTLDIGGDKTLPYFQCSHEENPFMGLRSIRISLNRQDIFRDQLASIMLAAPAGRPTIMFPLVSSIEELQKIRDIMSDVAAELQQTSGWTPIHLPVGAMIEIPAAVQIIDAIIDEVDYVSIGTNDLIQYTLAADRNNPLVKQYYDPHHPAVLHSIKKVADAANRAKKKISVCGEMASYPINALLLAGMGVTEFSLSAPSIPVVKQALRKHTYEECRQLSEEILGCRTGSEVRKKLAEFKKLKGLG